MGGLKKPAPSYGLKTKFHIKKGKYKTTMSPKGSQAYVAWERVVDKLVNKSLLDIIF